ncbi:MAG: histidine kinase dimerization/phospho-acceptor domain-containing protein [Gammaproteobacteria bacterium]
MLAPIEVESSAIKSINLDYGNWTGLQIYQFYRFILVVLVWLVQLFDFQLGLVFTNAFSPRILQYVLVTYTSVSLVFIVITLLRWVDYRNFSLISIFMDVFFLIGFLYATENGLQQGLGLLLIFNIAAAGVLLPGMSTWVLSALASLGVIAYAIKQQLNNNSNDFYMYTGLLGIAFFLTAFAFNQRSKYLNLADYKIKLKQIINSLVIEQIPYPILVLHGQEIDLFNYSAKSFLDLKSEILNQIKSELNLKKFRFQKENLLIYVEEISNLPEHYLVRIEEQKETLKKAQQLKLAALGRLTASIAHEIRNPLSAIVQSLQLFKSESNPKTQGRLLEITENNANRIEKIISSILSLSRSNPNNIERFELKSWLDLFVSNFKKSNKDFTDQINFRNQIQEIYVDFDRQQLEQILINLLYNAMHANHEIGSKKAIDLELFMHKNVLKIRVTNYDFTIKEEHKQNLFEPFFTTYRHGTGLGLYLSREMCWSNDAKLEYLEDKGADTCFQIVFKSLGVNNENA